MIFETTINKRDENKNPIEYKTVLYSNNLDKTLDKIVAIIFTVLTSKGWVSNYRFDKIGIGMLPEKTPFSSAQDSIKDSIQDSINEFTSTLNNFKIESDLNNNFIDQNIINLTNDIAGDLNNLYDYHVKLIEIFEKFNKQRGIDILPKTIYQLIKDNSTFSFHVTDNQTGYDLIDKDHNLSVNEIKKCLLNEYWDQVEIFINNIKIYTLYHRDLVI